MTLPAVSPNATNGHRREAVPHDTGSCAQKCEGDVDNSYIGVVSHGPDEINNGPDPIAIGLLKLQQRFDALDRLYNEEIGSLSQELAQLKAEYVRLFQSRSSLPRRGKTSRGQAKSSQLKS